MKESHHLKCEICLSEFQPELVEGISTEPAIGPVRSRYDVDSEAQRPDPNASSPRNWKPVIVTVGILAVLIGGYWSRPTCARSSLFALRSSLFARPDFPTLLLTPRASLVPRSPGVFVLVGLNIDKTWAQVGVGLDRRALARPDSLTRYALFALRCCSESLRFPYPPSSSCGSCGCTTGSQEENGRPRCPPHTRTARLASLARSPFFFVSCSTAPRSSSPRLQNPHLLLPTRSCSAQRHERAALVCSNPRSISSPKASRLRNPRSAGASAICQ